MICVVLVFVLCSSRATAQPSAADGRFAPVGLASQALRAREGRQCTMYISRGGTVSTEGVIGSPSVENQQITPALKSYRGIFKYEKF